MFIIKSYDGESMSEFIMYTFHEEVMLLTGECNTEYETQDDLCEYFNEKYNRIPDGILFIKHICPKIYTRVRQQLPGTKIILWTNDPHWHSIEEREMNRFSYTNADIHISHYNYFKMYYNLDIDDRVIHMPHSCNSDFFRKDVNLYSIDKIYMYGSTHSAHYRLRIWFINKIKEKYANTLVLKKHPGYWGDYRQESIDTAKELYKYSFSYTSSAFPKFEIKETPTTPYYLIGKIFEIAGSGVLLLCNDYNIREQLNELGFYDMVNYVNIDENNFDERMKWLFNDKNKVDIWRIRFRGYELVKNNHRTIKRIDGVNKKLELCFNN